MIRNLLEYLEATAARVPEKIAFSDEFSSLTFRETLRQARSLGSALLRRGIRNRPVALLMERRAGTVAAFLGVLYAGCAFVPLDGEMPKNRLERILRRLPVLLCDQENLETARALSPSPLSVEDLLREYPDDDALAGIRAAQIDLDPAYIVFTSGSTGTPKGVVGTHRAVIDYIENLCPVLKFDETTVFGSQSPLTYDACLKEIIPALKLGARVHLIPRRLFSFPVKLVETLNSQDVNTICWVVPALTMVSGFRTFEKIVPEKLRLVAFASEVFPIRQLKLWQAAVPHARFVNLYGPTEATGICCYYEVDREFGDSETLPIGRPFPNTGVVLLDEAGTVSPDRGEICIRGTRLTQGYWEDPENTRRAFVENPGNPRETLYRTGDLGYFNDRGELMFLGRRDQQIKHMGHRIELGEIEAAAGAVPGVQSACCLFDKEKSRIVLCYVGDLPPKDLAAGLRRELPGFMLPNRLVPLPRLPLTPNGKPDRRYLAEHELR